MTTVVLSTKQLIAVLAFAVVVGMAIAGLLIPCAL